ncbi:MAG: hypothetical protein E7294_02650 [Lachnospiraceae bacterium]|nr:hypothetical protein [Lachnospiraceae bacterium]
MQGNRKQYPSPMTPKTLFIYILTVILFGLFAFFIRGDMAGKMAAVVVCPMLIGYLIYAYFKEHKADKHAGEKKERMTDGSYFESPKWRENYIKYINDHPFEKPELADMKKDLLKRFRRREYLTGMFFLLFLIFCNGCVFIGQNSAGRYILAFIGIVFFGLFFYQEFALYIGMPVRRWLKGDIDYNVLEASYIRSRMLTYKKNGLAFGTTHIHAFTEKKIYAIDYRLAEGISRKIVRLKTYEDGIYAKDEYQHFAVIHVRLPQSGNIHDVEIELNEYQVQMAIDQIAVCKPGKELSERLSFEEKKEDETV